MRVGGERGLARGRRGAEVVPTLVGSWSLVRAPTQAWTGPTTCGCICGGGGAAAAAAAAAAVGPVVASPRNSRKTAWPPSARTARSMPGCWSSVKTRAKAAGTDRALAGRLSQSEESRSTSFVVMGRRCAMLFKGLCIACIAHLTRPPIRSNCASRRFSRQLIHVVGCCSRCVERLPPLSLRDSLHLQPRTRTADVTKGWLDSPWIL